MLFRVRINNKSSDRNCDSAVRVRVCCCAVLLTIRCSLSHTLTHTLTHTHTHTSTHTPTVPYSWSTPHSSSSVFLIQTVSTAIVEVDCCCSFDRSYVRSYRRLRPPTRVLMSLSTWKLMDCITSSRTALQDPLWSMALHVVLGSQLFLSYSCHGPGKLQNDCRLFLDHHDGMVRLLVVSTHSRCRPSP